MNWTLYIYTEQTKHAAVLTTDQIYNVITMQYVFTLSNCISNGSHWLVLFMYMASPFNIYGFLGV